MQDHIAAHICEPITLCALGRAAGYSPWYAARIFREITGKAPFEYIRAMRLSKAAARLHRGGVRVIDVAFDFVFGSHEGFTRAFSRQFGLSPRAYAKQKPPIMMFAKRLPVTITSQNKEGKKHVKESKHGVCASGGAPGAAPDIKTRQESHALF